MLSAFGPPWVKKKSCLLEHREKTEEAELFSLSACAPQTFFSRFFRRPKGGKRAREGEILPERELLRLVHKLLFS